MITHVEPVGPGQGVQPSLGLISGWTAYARLSSAPCLQLEKLQVRFPLALTGGLLARGGLQVVDVLSPISC